MVEAMIEAGSESTSSTLLSCLKFMAASPSIQRRAHAEISNAAGEMNFPNFSHRQSCPYIHACIRETLRLRPSTNNGSPHYTSTDTTYKDFFIPKGTVVSVNQYAIFSNPTLFANPERFHPERFLDGENSDENPEGSRTRAFDGVDRYVWGAGRRVCPGIQLAENSLFITLANVLWAFDIRPELDADKTEVAVDLSDDAYEPGRVTVPKLFKLRFIPRSKEIEDLVMSEGKKAKTEI